MWGVILGVLILTLLGMQLPSWLTRSMILVVLTGYFISFLRTSFRRISTACVLNKPPYQIGVSAREEGNNLVLVGKDGAGEQHELQLFKKFRCVKDEQEQQIYYITGVPTKEFASIYRVALNDDPKLDFLCYKVCKIRMKYVIKEDTPQELKTWFENVAL